MTAEKKGKMTSFWSERARQYGHDPRANTNDIWLREVEIAYVNKIIAAGSFPKIMDFGCANGFSTGRLAKLSPNSNFLGIDINADMIDVARKTAEHERLPNLEFRKVDVVRDTVIERFEFIYGVRVFQNIESFDMQKRVLDRILDLLKPGGKLLLIESYRAGYTRLNEDRVKMGLSPLPMHEHLTLLTEDFDRYASAKMIAISNDSLSSSYYLITRLLYSHIAKVNGEPIDYNHPIHQVAAMIPQIGEYGPQRATLYQCRS